MAEITPFEVARTEVEGLLVLTMKQVTDERGTVREFFRTSAFEEAGVSGFGPWLQINVTATRQGGVRGLHAEAMHKLVAVVAGEVFAVFVDLRAESPTFGAVVTEALTVGTQVLVPPGVGNGFQATSEGVAQYLYCFDREWSPGMAGTACTPLDPDLGIHWPIPVDRDDPSQLSAKDRDAPRLRDLQGAGR